MAFCVLRQLAKTPIATRERIALLAPAAVSLMWKGNSFSTSSNVQCSNKSNQVKSSNIFDQARAYSKENIKKNARSYVSDSDSDSDSDAERRKKKDAYTSNFWRQKMRTLHGIFDVNNDGVISFDDFKLLAKNFGDLGHLSHEQKIEFLEVLQVTWEKNFGEIDPYNLVSVEQYLTEMYHTMTDKDLRKKVHKFLPYLFQAVDNDHSGEISISEFKLFFKCLGLSERDAEVSFAAIDKNNDGMLSIKEFVNLGRDYFLTENPKRVSRHFWGPLASDH